MRKVAFIGGRSQQKNTGVVIGDLAVQLKASGCRTVSSEAPGLDLMDTTAQNFRAMALAVGSQTSILFKLLLFFYS